MSKSYVSRIVKVGNIKELNFRRSVSISQAPTGIQGDISTTTTYEENIKNAENLKAGNVLETAEFKALGTPQSVLSINCPPSVPVYLRRGSLLSIYGLNDSSSIKNVRSSINFINPIRRLLFGINTSSYQRLESTTPFSLLISATYRKFSIFKKSDNKSFVTISLDGSTDWSILYRDALQVYTGNSLTVSQYRVPRTISRKLSRTLNIPSNTTTGLFKWNKSGFIFLSGRGQVGLVGNGAIYNINLDDKEELLINRDNLLGLTVNGPFDLQNCVVEHNFTTHEKRSESSSVVQKPLGISVILKQQTTVRHKFKQIWSLFQYHLEASFSFLRGSRNKTNNFLVGNQNFVKIIGPRNLLLQSSSETSHIETPTPKRKNGVEVANVTGPKQTSADYLSYVTVTPGQGVKFESTPDFKDTVDKIERK
ncbi:predicted protein [Scheffersomyces stipitis CBS 6054]|uniref:Altered inheritance of mitochondria protein 24, mitochondrial n=1 Tax=Scheffersomyces stipitis (strain ATCC 58785 / CBS 6054 / NBRC 10063 / NRRL Y-11545) TaxID=322104 RepID=AIM24_PICST|nr:predicted protein [Scheffersomyces stipitis CBS 6054]A3LZY1.1 RecName: Full=Altered inheritance of mitochondria protein 24, mitochondrial; Flags: Precursor [Scheffersomyces stipitis CBS 6054]ABN68423.1 predicted protein [Scheffersomyces stipitis CBS 6054]KAG2731059.1 hypothetical protein G9P44_006208 [Scheffersomyces stipitis]